MKKKFTLLMMALLMSVMAFADSKCNVDFSKIQRWVGSGDNQAALVIQWNDGKDDNKMLVWGYRWAEGETKTGADMVLDIAKADPAFTTYASDGSWGMYIQGFGYDLNGDGNMAFDNKGSVVYPRNGRVDNWTPQDETDHWKAGFSTSGYFAYYLAGKTGDDYSYAPVGASSRKLQNGCVDLWSYGNGGVTTTELSYLPKTSFWSQGALVVNEDYYGKKNSTITFLGNDGEWNYNAIDNIGATACFGTYYGNKFYAIAKQAKDGGATVTGGRITICDANSLKVLKQIETIDGTDGRAFVGVDEHKGYVSTSKGIYILDLDKMEIAGKVSDVPDVECGNMIRLNEYVYAVAKGKGIVVIDPETDKAVNTVDGSYASITLSKDGNLWVSYSAGGLGKLNLTDNSVEKMTLPDGVGNPATSPWAWTADGLCASAQHNVIYWTVADASQGSHYVFKYDIDKKEYSKYIDISSDPEKWFIYGCSFRIDPVTDEAYVGMNKGWGQAAKENTVRKYDAEGKLVAEYPMEPDKEKADRNCWFPGIFVFPDTEDPVVTRPDAASVEVGQTTTVDLSNIATDADNMDAAIVKTVSKVSDEDVVSVEMKNGNLVVKGLKEGSSRITIKVNSNGIVATTAFTVTVTAATGINEVKSDASAVEVARFTVDGKRISAPQKGINIVRMSDGTTRKVVVK